MKQVRDYFHLNMLDPFGVGIQVLINHYLFFTEDNSEMTQRTLQYEFDTEPIVFLATTTSSKFSSSQINETGSQLPNLVKFYIRPFGNNEYLIRIHNLDSSNNQTVPFVDSQNHPIILQHLVGENYAKWTVSGIKELTLGGNQLRDNMLLNKYRWNGNFNPIVYDKSTYG